MQAQAVVAVQPGQVEYQTISVPDPGPEDIVVRITHSWISNGTEGSFVRGERIAGDTPRASSDPLPFPHVPGYQKVGVVEWIGPEAERRGAGISTGETIFATVSRVDGMFYPAGGHVSPAVTHFSQIWKLPPALPPVSAACLVLTQVGYNVGIRPALVPGDAAVVIGDGMVGHWAAQTLKHRGARVLLLGRHDDRLERFVVSDGDRLVNTKRMEMLDVVREWAPEGVQVVADTVGTIETLENLLPLIRRDGHISSAGFYGLNGRIDIQQLRNREITLHAPAGWTKERMDQTLTLLTEGTLQTLPLLTHRFPAAQAAEAFALILSKQPGVLGVLLDWETEAAK